VNVVLKFSPIARPYRRRARGKMLKALRPELASITAWSAVDTELRAEMAEVTERTPRVHPMPQYAPIYESVIDRARPIRMLEIGSFYEDSVRRWQQYLHPDSLIVGVDLDARLARIAEPGSVHVRIDDGQDQSMLQGIAQTYGPFDVIIDAGSKTSSGIALTFRSLFEDALRDNGVYLVEDVYCDYWTFAYSFSLTDLGRALVDAVCGHYRIATNVANFRTGHLVIAQRAGAAARADR
jgi:hypothetical protein